MSDFDITTLDGTPEIIAELSGLLIETVAHGGSVSFMHPLGAETARAFWEGSLARAARDERVVLGAWDEGHLIGTVTLLLDLPPNQPHRAEIAKMMTRVGYRGRGVGSALMKAAERLAMTLGRTLLVLDTAEDGGAAGLYERLGYQLSGAIPDYALKPHGGLTPTLIYWKRLPPKDLGDPHAPSGSELV